MARKWQMAVAFGKRRITSHKAHACSNNDARSRSNGCTCVADKGHFMVYTSDGKRFMVPLEYLSSSAFRELFRLSEEEFGLPADGPIKLPCDAVFVEYVLSLLRRRVSEDVERTLLSSIFVLHQSASSFAVGHAPQVAVCSY